MARFSGMKFKFWKHGDHGKIKCESFVENAKGQWFLNLVVEKKVEQSKQTGKVADRDLWQGKDFQIVSEKNSTITCSVCLEKSGPSGLSGLGIRRWKCSSCGTHHLRDDNSAKNILHVGLGQEAL